MNQLLIIKIKKYNYIHLQVINSIFLSLACLLVKLTHTLNAIEVPNPTSKNLYNTMAVFLRELLVGSNSLMFIP